MASGDQSSFRTLRQAFEGPVSPLDSGQCWLRGAAQLLSLWGRGEPHRSPAVSQVI